MFRNVEQRSTDVRLRVPLESTARTLLGATPVVGGTTPPEQTAAEPAHAPAPQQRRGLPGGESQAARSRSTGSASFWSSRYRRRVFATDLVVTSAAVVLGTLPGTGAQSVTPAQMGRAALMIVVWMVVLEALRTRSPRRMAVGAEEYKRIVYASAVTASIRAVIAVVLGPQGSLAARPHLLLTFPLGLVGLLLGRWIWRSWLYHQRARGVALSDVVVVGQPADVRYVLRQIARKSAVAYRVVGVVLDASLDPDTGGAGSASVRGGPVDLGPGNEHLPRFRGTTDQVPDVVCRLGADAVIVAGSVTGGNRAIRDLGWALEPSQTDLVLVSSLTNVAGPRITMRPVEGLPLMHVERPQFEGGRHLVKRALDIVVSALALVMMLPLFAVIAVVIARDSKGGVFFSQIRTGRRGRPFRMHKFRTMVATAEQDRLALTGQNEAAGPLFKLRDDPRITGVGAWLRRHSLDELPQFWNVLRGDMSLVGPRPPLPEEVATYEGCTGRRLYIKPGLTGLWQISGRSNLDWEESVRLDLYYVENWSVTGDLLIMWRTFKVMIHPEGAF